MQTEQALLRLLAGNQENMPSRGNTVSESVPFVSAVTREELESTWKERTTCHLYGKASDRQQAAEEKEVTYHSLEGFSAKPVPAFSCAKGCKGRMDFLPNQDNFSITYAKSNWRIACVTDGHGANGHRVATRVCQTVPYYLMQSASFPGDMRRAASEAFELCQQDLLATAVEDTFDVHFSGATIAVAIWKDDKLWTAHCGDCRVIVGYETGSKELFATRDHKPDCTDERARVEANGGEVRVRRYNDEVRVLRVYVKGYDLPGLCVTRSLGDESVKVHGVIAAPEVSEIDLQLDQKPFLLLATDGVWEVLDSDFVSQIVQNKVASDPSEPQAVIRELHQEAQQRWRAESGGHCDDITTILVFLAGD